MRFLLKLIGWLVFFAAGLVTGFTLSPAKNGFANTVNYNFAAEEEYGEDEIA